MINMNMVNIVMDNIVISKNKYIVNNAPKRIFECNNSSNGTKKY
jgi:hypothetical protein